jgi:hypothetical protein
VRLYSAGRDLPGARLCVGGVYFKSYEALRRYIGALMSRAADPDYAFLFDVIDRYTLEAIPSDAPQDHTTLQISSDQATLIWVPTNTSYNIYDLIAKAETRP